MRLTHWKSFKQGTYLGSCDLSIGEDEQGNIMYNSKIVTIKNIVREEVFDNNSNSNKVKVVCYFENNIKPMILNVTNLKSIEKVCKTPFMEHWKGQSISIYVAKNIKVGKNYFYALRIENFAPANISEVYNCEKCKKETTKNIALRTEKNME